MSGKFSKSIYSISDKGILKVVDNNNNNNNNNNIIIISNTNNNNNNIINLFRTNSSCQSKDLKALRQVYSPNYKNWIVKNQFHNQTPKVLLLSYLGCLSW